MVKLNRQNYVVFVVAAMASFSFLLGSLLFLYEVRRQNEQRSSQYLRDATSQRRAALDQQIGSDLQVLRGVAIGLAEIDLGRKENLLKLLDGVNRSNSFVRMGLAGTDGIVDLVDLDGTVYANVNLSGMDFFQTALAGNEGMSGTFSSPTTSLDVNIYTTPVYQSGDIVGVLCAVNTDEILWTILNVPVFQGQGQFLVTNSEGIIVSPVLSVHKMYRGSDITQMLKFSSPEYRQAWLQTMAAGDPGQYIAEMAGESVIVTSQPLGYNAWHVLSIIPRAGITAYYNHVTVGITAIILAACLLFMLLLLWQMRMMNRNKKSLERLAYTDTITGASNQVKFLLDADRLLKGKDKKIAVWSFDIKRFTNINDLFGVATGDRMLKWIALMFEQLALQDSVFCRFSADLFVGLRPYREKQELHDWVLRLWVELAQQEIVPTSKMHIDSAMGFFCIEDYHGERPDITITIMVNWASMARKKAKQFAGSEMRFFTEDMSEKVRWEAELEAGSRAALLHGDITFFLQPKVNIQDGCVVSGAEALARWQHPAHGWISPAEFIPLFEKNGFIIDLDRYIFDQACKWYAQERDQGTPVFQLAINVSRQGLLRADFLEYYCGVKQHYGIADGVLELEITENTVLDDYHLFQYFVGELQKRGFVCSIDDFGSGYSSLNMLKNITIDALKLDAVFLRDGIDTKREQTVITHFIHMARNLGIKIVAEGVETSQQVLFLQRTGCDIVQGYYFSKPLPLTDFERLMAKTGGQLSL